MGRQDGYPCCNIPMICTVCQLHIRPFHSLSKMTTQKWAPKNIRNMDIALFQLDALPYKPDAI